MRNGKIINACRIVLIGTSLLLATTANAQPAKATAQSLYDEAIEDLKADKHAEARRKLEEVTRLAPEAIGAKIELAKCYEELGLLASASAQYKLVVELASKAGQAERAKKAMARLDDIQPKLATLTIVVPPDVAKIQGLKISLDGDIIDAVQWGIPMPVDVGEHEISTQLLGGAVRREKINLEKGKSQSVVVSVDSASYTPRSNEPSLPPHSSDRRDRSVITGVENRELPISMALRRLALPHLTLSPYVDGEYTRGDLFGASDQGASNVGIALGLGGDVQVDADLIGHSYASNGSPSDVKAFWSQSRLGGTVRFFANERFDVGVRSHVFVLHDGRLLGIDLGIPVQFHWGQFVRIDSGVFAMSLLAPRFGVWLNQQASRLLGFLVPTPGIPLEIYINPLPQIFIQLGAGIGTAGTSSIDESDSFVLVPLHAAIGGTVRLGTRGCMDIIGNLTLPFVGSNNTGLDFGIPYADLRFPVVGLSLKAYFPLAAPVRQTAASPLP